MSGPGSTPVGRAAAEKLVAKHISPDSSDSGYASTGNMTDGSTTDHSQNFADGVALPSRSFFERRVTKLRLFDREIPQLTQHRFHDLHELFEVPLCDYLIKAKVKPNPISIKLKVLGESEATAKPWIVVLCNKTVSKKIRQFFNQQQIKAAYQPSNPDSFLPSFEVFVCDRPPRPMAGTEIYIDYDETGTICGRSIKVGEAHQSRFATLGGVIKVIKPTGIITLHGMTAGHILAQQPLGQDSFDQVEYCDEKDEEDEGFYSAEEEYELDDSFDSDEEVQEIPTTGDRARSVSQSTQLEGLWPKIGCVSAASNEGTGTGNDLDWALIDFDKPTDYRPNLLTLAGREEKAAINRPLEANENFTEDGSSRLVFLLTGTGGVKSGMLSTSLSFLMMGPAKAFTKTYTVVLPHGSVLNAGDCGSWVVDQSTFQVYGHVVASDAMGDTYVVPLNATLRDMEEKLGAAVCLPTESDIHTWLAQHAKAAAQEVTVPVKSMKKKVAFHDSRMDRAEPAEEPQRPAGQSLSQASASSAPAAIRTSTRSEDYCNSCNARFEGTPKDVRSNLFRHQQTCSRQIKDAALETESSTSQVAKDILDGRSNPVPWSIRSMISSFKQKPSGDSQQKAGNKGKSISSSKDNKPGGTASSKKPAAPASLTSPTKSLKNDTKKSQSKKDSASPPMSKSLPAPPTPPAARDHKSSLPVATSIPPRIRPGGRALASPPPREAPPLVHGHKGVHETSLDPPNVSHSRSSRQVSYEGYTFTKCDSKQTGQKETWAVARMAPMPVSQEDLKNHIERHRKRHISALDEYNDEKMKGFKRKQVDNLIRERTKIDGDYGYEYVLASIKLDVRKTKSKLSETLSMQVILKRQLRADLPRGLSTEPSMDLHAKLPSQVMDLTIGDEPGKAKDYGGGTQDVSHRGTNIASASRPECLPVPVIPTHSQFLGHGVQRVDNRPPLFVAAPHPFSSLTSPAQGMRQPPPPPSFTPLPHSFPAIRQESHGTQGHLEVNNSKEKKKKAPKVVHTRLESRKKHDYVSTSDSLSESSLELDSDRSCTQTDATPDTVFSGESREHRKERKSHKESKDSSYDDIERTPHAHETERPSYRVHRRRDHRHSSLSPARRSRDVSSDWIHTGQDLDLDLERHGRRTTLPYSYGTDYRAHGPYEVEPAISFPTYHAPQLDRSRVSPERPLHPRALSYDLDRSTIHNSRALVPIPRRSDLYNRGEELAREQEFWERGELQLERDQNEARARRMRELEIQEREGRYARMDRMREMERRYTPRRPRDTDYF